MAVKKPVKRRKKAEAKSRGIEARDAAEGTPPGPVTALVESVRHLGEDVPRQRAH